MNLERPKSSQPMPPEAKLVFEGIVFGVYLWERKMFNGSYEIFEKLKRKDPAMIIPITNDLI